MSNLCYDNDKEKRLNYCRTCWINLKTQKCYESSLTKHTSKCSYSYVFLDSKTSHTHTHLLQPEHTFMRVAGEHAASGLIFSRASALQYPHPKQWTLQNSRYLGSFLPRTKLTDQNSRTVQEQERVRSIGIPRQTEFMTIIKFSATW